MTHDGPMSSATATLRRTWPKKIWPSLIVFLLLAFAAAAIGGVAASSARDTYDALTLPAWAPPGWLFGPVWSVLYVTIGVAGWMIWHADGGRGTPIALWGAQLVLNACWTPLFFAAEQYELALAEICLLWIVLVATIVVAARIHRWAGGLLLPYMAWVSFATALNTSIVVLN